MILGEVLLAARSARASSSLRPCGSRPAAYAPIGRLFGGGYVGTHDRFEMRRITYREWLARSRDESAS